MRKCINFLWYCLYFVFRSNRSKQENSMRRECIDFESYKIWESNKSLSSDECWKLAEKRLSIFSDEIHNMNSTYGYSGSCASSQGSFGIDTKYPAVGAIQTVVIDHCRELFEHKFITGCTTGHTYNPNHCYFLSSLSNDVMERVAKFIRETENTLNLFHLSKFNRTQHHNVMKITLSDFWKGYSPDLTMRISVFSLLLRCGVNYYGDYRAALNSVPYAVVTMPALNVFLSGKTKFLGTHQWHLRKNWVHNFQNLDESTSARLLVA